MQYMLVFRDPLSEFARRDDPAQAPAYWGAWQAYVGAVRASGKLVNGDGLDAPARATVVRLRDGRRLVQDGPFPDTLEHLGGYFVLEVDSLDEALEWAARAPAADSGSVEVRPVLTPQGR